MRRTGVAVAAALLAGACSPAADPRPATRWERDVAALGRHFERRHADLDALIPAAVWSRAADALAAEIGDMDRNEALVELMRLAALPGRTTGGDGHSGIFPLDAHEPELHLLPLRLYEFPDGFYVVGAPGRADLVGARLTHVEGRPVAEVAALVEPLVPRDNTATVAARLPHFMLTVEVLDGLGVVADASSVEVGLDTGTGAATESFEPVHSTDYAAETGQWHPMIPPGLPAPGSRREWSSDYLPRDDVVYVRYDQTVGDSFALGRRILRLVRRHDPRGIVLDLRHNPGGENEAAAGLLDSLASLRGSPLAVLVGRGTFSAAGILALRLRERAAPVFVGEDTGFSTRFFGDPDALTLSETGLVVNAGAVEWDEGGDGSFDRSLEPDVEVTLTAGAYFSRRDPVLRAAVARLRRN